MESTVVGIASVESKDINTAKGPGTLFIVKDDLGVEYTTFDRELAVQAAGLKGHSATIGFDTTTNVKPNRQGVDTTYTNRYLKTLGAGSVVSTPVASEHTFDSQVAPVPTVTAQGVTAPPSGIQAQSSHSTQEESIARAVALKAAVELASNGVLEDPTRNGIVRIAESFERYLLGHEALAAVGLAVQSEQNNADDIPF